MCGNSAPAASDSRLLHTVGTRWFSATSCQTSHPSLRQSRVPCQTRRTRDFCWNGLHWSIEHWLIWKWPNPPAPPPNPPSLIHNTSRNLLHSGKIFFFFERPNPMRSSLFVSRCFVTSRAAGSSGRGRFCWIPAAADEQTALCSNHIKAVRVALRVCLSLAWFYLHWSTSPAVGDERKCHSASDSIVCRSARWRTRVPNCVPQLSWSRTGGVCSTWKSGGVGVTLPLNTNEHIRRAIFSSSAPDCRWTAKYGPNEILQVHHWARSRAVHIFFISFFQSLHQSDKKKLSLFDNSLFCLVLTGIFN